MIYSNKYNNYCNHLIYEIVFKDVIYWAYLNKPYCKGKICDAIM